MNTTAMTRLTHAVMIVAALAAIVIVMPVKATTPASAVVVLPRVVVSGRAVQPVAQAPREVVRLPRVVVSGRRADPAEAVQARRNDARPQPAPLVVAMR